MDRGTRIAGPYDLNKQVLEALGLTGKFVVELTLKFSANQPPTAIVETLIPLHNAEMFKALLERTKFELVEIGREEVSAAVGACEVRSSGAPTPDRA